MQQSKRRSLTKLGYLVMVALLSVIVLSACGAKNAETEEGARNGGQASLNDIADDMIVAKYDGGEVTGAEFKAYRGVTRLFVGPQYDQLEMMDPNIHETLVTRIVAFESLQNRADEQLRQKEEERAKKDLEELKTYIPASSGGEASLESMLEEAGVTEEELFNYLVQSNIVHAVMSSDIDDEQVQAEYERLNAEKAFDMATVRHILIGLKDDSGEDIRTKEEALERAKEVIGLIENGQDMEKLAAEYSDDPGSRDNGGLYESTNVNVWVPQFKEAAIELPLNEVSQPVETDYGYHVMRVEARETLTLEQVSEELRGNLAQEEVASYVDEVVPGLIQEINLPGSQS